jgi:hypothetical protein
MVRYCGALGPRSPHKFEGGDGDEDRTRAPKARRGLRRVGESARDFAARYAKM